MVVGKGTQVVVNSGGQEATFEYCSTEAIGEAGFTIRCDWSSLRDGSMPVYFSEGTWTAKGASLLSSYESRGKSRELQDTAWYVVIRL